MSRIVVVVIFYEISNLQIGLLRRDWIGVWQGETLVGLMTFW